jgi:hypothetical protein
VSRCTHYGLKLILFAVCGEGHAKFKLKIETYRQGTAGTSLYNIKQTLAQERNEVAALLVSHSVHQSVHKITVTKCTADSCIRNMHRAYGVFICLVRLQIKNYHSRKHNEQINLCNGDARVFCDRDMSF